MLDLFELARTISATSGYGRYPEIRDLLLTARPSRGFCYLQRDGALRLFPQLWALVGLPQDPRWHPEGDAWTHTLLVLDQAALQRSAHEMRDEVLMFAALCHDLGKPEVTEEHEGRIRSHSHEPAGVEPAIQLLHQLGAPRTLVPGVTALVRHHMAPVSFVRCNASAKGYRRLARKLSESGVDIELLMRLVRADQLGRTDRPRRFVEGELFLERARRFGVV